MLLSGAEELPIAGAQNTGDQPAHLRRLKAAPQGTRNAVLNEIAFSLGVAECALGIEHNAAFEELLIMALDIGLSRSEITSTIQSGRRAGRTKGQSQPVSITSSSPSSISSHALSTVVNADPYVWTDEASLSKRDWLYGHHLIRKFVSLTVAPGGLGKSALTTLEAILMASGKRLLGYPLVPKRQRVWLYNLEDPYEELQRRIQATCKKLELTAGDVDGHLLVNSGRDQQLVLASTNRNGTVINSPIDENIIEELKRNQIDVLVIDPFVSSHMVNENDNMAIDMVAKAWARIADKANVAIELVHHTRKLQDGVSVGAESARGAVSLIGAARDVRVLYQMSECEALTYGEANPRILFGVKSDKHNLTAGTNDRDWYRMVSIELDNGDVVGVPAIAALAKVSLQVTDEQKNAFLEMVRAGEFRKDSQADHWVGLPLAEVLSLDWGAGLNQRTRSVKQKLNRSKMDRQIREWLLEDVLIIDVKKMSNGKEVEFVTVPEQDVDQDTSPNELNNPTTTPL
jgi:hypothetical protein